MAASGAFRSHLMQQFASAARCQSRPPLALLGWKSSSSKSLPLLLTDSPSSECDQHDTSRASLYKSLLMPSTREPSPPPQRIRNHRHASSVASDRVIENPFLLNKPTEHDDSALDDAASTMAYSMQSMIQTRRTVSSFDKSSHNIKDALGRAVACGLNAPNHHRTQAFSFKRLLSPSESTDRLADIAYNVKLRKNPTENHRRLAERKREKWSQIPGFLVTLVDGQSNQEMQGEVDDAYEEIPFVGPSTEQQLEDYAAACAAVQNVLLSLHAEGIGAKWATGPVTRTPAFRSLVKAQHDERVVALVMVGHPRRIPKPPRRQRPMKELFHDL